MLGPVVNQYELGLSLNDIPDMVCQFGNCGGQTRKVLIPLEWNYKDYSRNEMGVEMIAYCKMPGYLCRRCGLEGIDLNASVIAYDRALRIVKAAGDLQIGALLEGSVRAGREQLIRFGLLE